MAHHLRLLWSKANWFGNAMLALRPKGSHSRFESRSCVIVPY